MDFDKYDIEYLVSQYEMMEEVYSHPESFGKERIAKMKVAFDSFDKDGNGVLDRDEVGDLLKMHFKEHGINKQPTKADVDQFFDKLDEDKNDTIDFDEFKIFLIQNMKQQLVKPLAEYLKSQGFNLEEDEMEFKFGVH